MSKAQEAADAILRAAGSGLRHYMPATRDKIVETVASYLSAVEARPRHLSDEEKGIFHAALKASGKPAAVEARPAQEPVAWVSPEALEFLRGGSFREVTIKSYREGFQTEPLFAAPVELDGLRRELEEAKKYAASFEDTVKTAGELMQKELLVRVKAERERDALRSTLTRVTAERDEAVRLLGRFCPAEGVICSKPAIGQDTDSFLSRLSRKDADNG